ncbi:MAG: patatin-like phospholipase RssA [Burkholderiales bacterium]
MPASSGNARIGLALGSGGARVWSHIGVIEALHDMGVKPEVVCGTSIGALVGTVYAAGDLERLERWVRGLSRRNVLQLMDVAWRGGLIKGRRLFDFFAANIEDRNLAALAMPCGVVATDLATGREIWLREGPMLEAVHASIAMPGLFTPIERDGMLLVDGGLVNPVPVSMCRALGAEVVIAVDLGWAKFGRFRPRVDAAPSGLRAPSWLDRLTRLVRRGEVSEAEQRRSAPSIVEAMLTSVDIMQVRVARSRLAGDPAEVMVTPLLPDFATMDFHRAAEAIAEGRAAVARARPMLERMMEV